jgi:hypothetical protein
MATGISVELTHNIRAGAGVSAARDFSARGTRS